VLDDSDSLLCKLLPFEHFRLLDAGVNGMLFGEPAVVDKLALRTGVEESGDDESGIVEAAVDRRDGEIMATQGSPGAFSPGPGILHSPRVIS